MQKNFFLGGQMTKPLYKHEYAVTEQTLDVRNYTLMCDDELTEEECLEVFYEVDYIDNATNVVRLGDKSVLIKFDGTDFGDDGQLDWEVIR